MAAVVLLALIAVVAFWAIASYNRLVGMRNQVLNGWRQIDVQLKRRHDLIPNLVNAVRGSMDFERETLTAVMEARAKALTATGPSDAAVKEGQPLFASAFGFRPAELFEIAEAADREVPVVDLSQKR